jgi:dihydropteroate synthase
MKPSLLFESPCVMGILNLTPDSFSDGGQLFHDKTTDIDLALQRALQMQRDGAAIIDIGGESTRPGAATINVQEELDRVLPVVEALHSESNITISIDTRKADVMREAINAGATFINDVCALQQAGALDVAVRAARTNPQLRVCLMHMQGEPQSMQQAPHYNDVVAEVKAFLQQRIAAVLASGIDPQQVVIDPGFGFGKTLEHNLALIRNLSALDELGCTVLVGVSRKRMIAQLTGRSDVGERLAGSLALAWACLQQGAKILRVHDVKETVDLVKIFQAIQSR